MEREKVKKRKNATIESPQISCIISEFPKISILVVSVVIII